MEILRDFDLMVLLEAKRVEWKEVEQDAFGSKHMTQAISKCE